MTNEDRLDFLTARGYRPEQEYPEPQALSRIDIEELIPLVDFQAHTMTHPILPGCTDDVARREMEQCKADLEAWLGFNIMAVAFPNGDYSDREIKMARAVGYSCALTLDNGSNSPNTELFRLKRTPLPDGGSVSEILVKASGLWNLLRPLFRAPLAKHQFTDRENLAGSDYYRRASKTRASNELGMAQSPVNPKVHEAG